MYPDGKVKYHGLKNQGATCYLNSVLQVLFMTKDYRDAVKRHNSKNPDTDFIDGHLATLFDDLQEKTAFTYKITDALGIDRVFEQRDAAEYFEKILSLTSPDASQIFHGQLTHKTICSTCGAESDSDGAFWHLPLALVDSYSESYSVVNGIKEYFKDADFSGENQMYCDWCDDKSDATIKCVVKHHPEVLMLMLKRFEFSYSHMTYVKNHCTVEVPYTLEISENQTYERYAVVDHYGDLRRGHYTATIKSQNDDDDDGKWYFFNDSTVTLLDYQPFQVNHCETSDSAYLLFYRKVNVHAEDTCTQDIREMSSPEDFPSAASDHNEHCQDSVKMKEIEESEEYNEENMDLSYNPKEGYDEGQRNESKIIINDKEDVRGKAEADDEAKKRENLSRGHPNKQDEMSEEQRTLMDVKTNDGKTEEDEESRKKNDEAKKRENLSRENPLQESVENKDDDSGRQKTADAHFDLKPTVSDRHVIQRHPNKQDEVKEEQGRVMDVKTNNDGKTGDDEESGKTGKSRSKYPDKDSEYQDQVAGPSDRYCEGVSETEESKVAEQVSSDFAVAVSISENVETEIKDRVGLPPNPYSNVESQHNIPSNSQEYNEEKNNSGYNPQDSRDERQRDEGKITRNDKKEVRGKAEADDEAKKRENLSRGHPNRQDEMSEEQGRLMDVKTNNDGKTEEDEESERKEKSKTKYPDRDAEYQDKAGLGDRAGDDKRIVSKADERYNEESSSSYERREKIIVNHKEDVRVNAEANDEAKKRENLSRENPLEETVKDQDNDSGRQKTADAHFDLKPTVSDRHVIQGHPNKQDKMIEEQGRVMDVKTNNDGKTGDDEESGKTGKSRSKYPDKDSEYQDQVGLGDTGLNTIENLGGSQEVQQHYGHKPLSADKQGDAKSMKMVEKEEKTRAEERVKASEGRKFLKSSDRYCGGVSEKEESEVAEQVSSDFAVAVSISENVETEIKDRVGLPPNPYSNVESQHNIPSNSQEYNEEKTDSSYNPQDSHDERQRDEGKITRNDKEDVRGKAEADDEAKKRENLPKENPLQESVENKDDDSKRQKTADAHFDLKQTVSDRHVIQGHPNKQDEVKEEQGRVMDVKTNNDGKTGDDEESGKMGKSRSKYPDKDAEYQDKAGLGDRAGDDKQIVSKADERYNEESSSSYERHEQRRGEKRDDQGVKEQKRGNDKHTQGKVTSDSQHDYGRDESDRGLDDIKQKRLERKTSSTHTRQEDMSVVKPAGSAGSRGSEVNQEVGSAERTRREDSQPKGTDKLKEHESLLERFSKLEVKKSGKHETKGVARNAKGEIESNSALQKSSRKVEIESDTQEEADAKKDTDKKSSAHKRKRKGSHSSPFKKEKKENHKKEKTTGCFSLFCKKQKMLEQTSESD